MKRALLCHAAALAVGVHGRALDGATGADQCARRLLTKRAGPSLGQPNAGAQNAVKIDNDDIGGVVTGPNGPEAGVWVIAETHDLPTRFAKIVVTDDQGRYVVPDLPKAKYQVWVRGYGLVDSAKVDATPGQHAQSHRGRRRPTMRRRHNIIRRSIGSRC